MSDKAKILELVERLRRFTNTVEDICDYNYVANTIENLANENAELRKQLEQAEARLNKRDEDLRRHDAYKIGFVDGLKHAIESVGDEVLYFSTSPASTATTPTTEKPA